LDRAFDYGSKG